MTKNREKRNRKIIFSPELSEANIKKIDKKSRKNRKIIFGSEFSETDNEPTF